MLDTFTRSDDPTLELMRSRLSTLVPPLDSPMTLRCGPCGKPGRYEIGTVLLSPRLWTDAVRILRAKGMPPAAAHQQAKAVFMESLTSLDDFIGFTAYFRCRHCDAGGPWRLPLESRNRIHIMMLALQEDESADCGMRFGELRSFTGQRVRYATEAEAIVREHLDRAPDDPMLWVRLGNVYKNGGRRDLAMAAYQRALALRPHDIEAHAMVGECLCEDGRPRESVEHWKAVLRYVREATHLPRDQRLTRVAAALDRGLRYSKDPREIYDLLPKASLADLPAPPDGRPRTLELRRLDPGRQPDRDEICALFVDGCIAPSPRRRLAWTRGGKSR